MLFTFLSCWSLRKTKKKRHNKYQMFLFLLRKGYKKVHWKKNETKRVCEIKGTEVSIK